jgi:hypothetical protein
MLSPASTTTAWEALGTAASDDDPPLSPAPRPAPRPAAAHSRPATPGHPDPPPGLEQLFEIRDTRAVQDTRNDPDRADAARGRPVPVRQDGTTGPGISSDRRALRLRVRLLDRHRDGA